MTTNGANIAEFKTNFVLKAAVQSDGKITATAGTASTDVVVKSQLDAIVSDAAYNATSWNGVTTVAPSKNAIRDKIESTGLQEITDINASTTNPINVTVTGASVGITGGSPNGKGINGYSDTGIGVDGFSTSGIAINGYSETGVAGSFDVDGTANIANFKSSGTLVAFVNSAGELTAQKLKKDGGTSAQILAADGSVITAGNNITITGGQISSSGSGGGGGASVNYYLNGGTTQGTFGGVTYYEFSKTAVIGTRVDFSVSSDGYIASFITDVADPSLLLIPIGNWIIEFYFSANSAGGSPSFYVELYKVSATNVFSPIASSSGTPEGITNGDVIDAYFTTLSVPETVLAVDDRLAIRVFVNASGKTITLHTQDETLCEVLTTFTTGLTALNGLQAQVQNFSLGTAGTDFDINSSGSTHTFNLPSASPTNRGVITYDAQTIAGTKTFSSNIVIPATGTPLILSVSSGGTVSGLTTSTYPDLTELSYVRGVTSAIQTQLNSKQANITLTTNFTSGAATLTGAILNIPQYSGATNLDYIPSPTNGTVTSSTGNSAILTLATATNAGLLTPAKFTVLENTSGTNTGDQNLSGYALLASPTFTGTPSLPTGTIGVTQLISDNTTKLATTAYVDRQVSLGNAVYNITISSFPGNAITTQDTGTSGGVPYSQNGRNVMINNGTTAITINANAASTDFIASYTKLSAFGVTVTFIFTAGTLIAPNGAVLNGSAGSTALLTKNGTIVYLLINNLA